MPVLHVRRNVDDCAGEDLDGGLALLLIPAAACDTDQHLSTAFRRAVDMPVVAATRLKRYIGDGNLFRRDAG